MNQLYLQMQSTPGEYAFSHDLLTSRHRGHERIPDAISPMIGSQLALTKACQRTGGDEINWLSPSCSCNSGFKQRTNNDVS